MHRFNLIHFTFTQQTFAESLEDYQFSTYVQGLEMDGVPSLLEREMDRLKDRIKISTETSPEP